MFLAVAQLGTDAHDKHGSVLTADGVLALLGRKVRIELAQLLAVDEEDILRQERLDRRISLADHELRTENGAVDFLHDFLQELDVAVLLADHALPVPLVDIERVQVVELLVGTDGIHVGDDAESLANLILGQGHTLPFCQRVYDLGAGLVHVLDGEVDGTFHAVQVIVHSQTAEHEQRRCDAPQTEFARQSGQEEVLDPLDGLLSLLQVQCCVIFLGYNQLTHFVCVYIIICVYKCEFVCKMLFHSRKSGANIKQKFQLSKYFPYF